SFKWRNLARDNAGVSCVIVGLARSVDMATPPVLYTAPPSNATALASPAPFVAKEVPQISPYLTAQPAHTAPLFIEKAPKPLCALPEMVSGNRAVDDGHLLVDSYMARCLVPEEVKPFLRPYISAEDFFIGKRRACLWITDEQAAEAARIPLIAKRLERVREFRLKSTQKSTREFAQKPWRLFHNPPPCHTLLVVPRISSETRPYLLTGLTLPNTIVLDASFVFYDAPLWVGALIMSRLHRVWIESVCGKLENRLRYSNTLGWNTFPVPALDNTAKATLTRLTENIFLTQEAHFPQTLAQLYKPDTIPKDLRALHQENDAFLEKLYQTTFALTGADFADDEACRNTLLTLYAQKKANPENPLFL
ncbi:MAG: lactate dehydrogenase, partial [Acetobacter sp.]|nr:lactate dehydrogenase [Acetobacter sp.]